MKSSRLLRMKASLGRPLPALSIFVAALVATPACSSVVADDDGESADDLRKRPKGEELLSTLVVRVPPQVQSSMRTLWIDAEQEQATFGVARRVMPGEHTLWLKTPFGEVQKLALTLAAGEVRTLTLAAVRRTCTNEPLPRVPDTDFGVVVAPRNLACPSQIVPAAAVAGDAPQPEVLLYANVGRCGTRDDARLNASTMIGDCQRPLAPIVEMNIAGACTKPFGRTDPRSAFPFEELCTAYAVGDHAFVNEARPNGVAVSDVSQPVFPGEYSYWVGRTRVPFTVSEGEDRALGIVRPALPAAITTTSVTLELPVRQLPSAGGFSTTVTTSCANKRLTTKAWLKEDTVGTVTLTEAVVDPVHGCRSTVGTSVQRVELPSAAPIRFERLDVDDVEVQTELPGKTYLARGNYWVKRDGKTLLGPVPTNTGVDLLPGTYELTVEYTTKLGKRTTVETFTL